MRLPLTDEYLQEIEVEIERKTGKPINERRRLHSRIIANLINEAYTQGYNEALEDRVKMAQKGGVK